MVDHQHWQLDGNAPELFQRYLVPAIKAKWAEDIVDRARPQAGEEILDIDCGTGVVARLASSAIRNHRYPADAGIMSDDAASSASPGADPREKRGPANDVKHR
jgi:hypothetical protein